MFTTGWQQFSRVGRWTGFYGHVWCRSGGFSSLSSTGWLPSPDWLHGLWVWPDGGLGRSWDQGQQLLGQVQRLWYPQVWVLQRRPVFRWGGRWGQGSASWSSVCRNPDPSLLPTRSMMNVLFFTKKRPKLRHPKSRLRWQRRQLRRWRLWQNQSWWPCRRQQSIKHL